MYKYYMGKESNLSRKKPSDPIVVGFTSRAYEAMNGMLDFYRIDFDKIAEIVKFIANAEPVNIYWMAEENLYLITCNNEKTLRLEWNEKKTDNTELAFFDEELLYIADFSDELVLRMKVKTCEDYQYQVKYMPLSQKIDFFLLDMNYLTIQIDSTDKEIFDIMMNLLEDVEEFDGLPSFMEWFSPILNERNISDVSVVYRETMGNLDEMIEISDGIVQFYTCENDDETFQVDTYGNWVARVKNMKGWYDAKTKNHTFDEIKGLGYPVVEFGVAVDRMNQIVAEMFERLEVFKEMID